MSARSWLLVGLASLAAVNLSAQQPLPKAAPTPVPTAAPPTPEQRISRALEKRASLEVLETPLSEVVDDLHSKTGIPIRLDKKALADAGIGTDTPVTRNLPDLPLKTLLRIMLADLDLTYMVRDESIIITTPEEARNHRETRLIPVSDLLEPEVVREADASTRDGQALIDAITTALPLSGWRDEGGNAIRQQGKSLVVSLLVHELEEVEALLEQLRSAHQLWKKWDGKTRATAVSLGSLPPRDENPNERRIAKALLEATSLDVKETPLSEVVEELAEKHNIQIVWDQLRIQNAGIERERPVTERATGISLAAALRGMLRDVKLTFTIRDDVLLITTHDSRDRQPKLRIYPVFDLIEEKFGHFPVEHAAIDPALDNDLLNSSGELSALITAAVQPKLRDVAGGRSPVHYHPQSRALLITATDEAHAEIEALLAKLRAVTPIPRKMSQEIFDEHERTVISHVFLLAGDSPVRPMPEAKEIAETIRATVSPEIWKTPGNTLSPLRGRLRVVAPRRTVRAVDKLLRELDVLVPPTSSTPVPVRVPNAAQPAARP